MPSCSSDSSFLPMQTLGDRVMDQVVGLLSPTWETWIAFSAPAYLGCCEHMQSEAADESIFSLPLCLLPLYLSLLPSLSLFLPPHKVNIYMLKIMFPLAYISHFIGPYFSFEKTGDRCLSSPYKALYLKVCRANILKINFQDRKENVKNALITNNIF